MKTEFNGRQRNHSVVNCMNEDLYREKVKDIISTCAEILAKTMGPYGKHTVIQNALGVSKTKDGKNVLLDITFRDILDNTIKKIIEDVAVAAVLNAGDGSTTSVVAADILNKHMEELAMDKTITARDLETALLNVVNRIIEQLQVSSKKINMEDPGEFIKKIALVSTNWNIELADHIAEIYSKTHNPIIKVHKSLTEETSVSYIEEGYDIAGSLEDKTYLTNREKGISEFVNPMILMFDHAVPNDYHMLLMQMIQGRGGLGQCPMIVVLAPAFDKTFLNTIQVNNEHLYKNGIIYPVCPVQVFSTSSFDKLCINDFRAMIGANLISNVEDLNEMVMELKQERKKAPEEQSPELPIMIDDYISRNLGTCEKIVIENKTIVAQGLINRNDEEYKVLMENAEKGLSSSEREASGLNMITENVRLRKFRLGKLRCKMGTINIGGYGDSDVKAKIDALDDAIRACEEAYYNGYVQGSSLAIPSVINSIDVSGMTPLEISILSKINITFREVCKVVVSNKLQNISTEWGIDTTIEEIIEKAISEGKAINIIGDIRVDEDENVINSVTTDIEALRSTARLVLLNITSNQFLYMRYEAEGMKDQY